MCYGPVQVLWNDQEESAYQAVDDKLILFTAFDLIEIDPEKSYNASPNEYDFYFMARQKIEAKNARLHIFFPFSTNPMPMRFGVNNSERRDIYLTWQMRFFEQTLRTQDRHHAHSFGWDEAEARRLLPPTPNNHDSIAALFKYHLQRALTEDFALNDGIQIESVSFPGETVFNDSYQRFIVTLNGTIEAGQIFHVYFEADTAPGDPIVGSPCAGEALLYHYDQQFGELETAQSQDPFRFAPTVPCTLLQVAMMFPAKANVRPRSYAKSTLQNPKKLISPTGHVFPDWRWFVICNAHMGFKRRNFMTWWDLADCPDRHDARPKTLHALLADELIQAISQDERKWIANAIEKVADLSSQELEIAIRIADSQTNRKIAEALHVVPKTVEKHVTHIYHKLGFDELSKQAPHLRKVVLLAKTMMFWRLQNHE